MKLMKDKGTHEDCIEQIMRLLSDRLYGPDLQLDELGRIRVDDWEMAADIQAGVNEVWPQITSDTLNTLADYSGYQHNFLALFGFGLPGVDYDGDVEVDLALPSNA